MFWSKQLQTATENEKIFSGTFINEVCINECLKTFVHDYKNQFCVFLQSWKSKRQGNIIMEYCGKPISDVIKFLNKDDIECIVFQLLNCLCWAQTQIHLKHHDIHTDNIFIQLIENETILGELISDKRVQTTVPIMNSQTTNPKTFNGKNSNL